MNVSPLLDLGAGSAADDDRVCYRLKCPVAAAPAQVVSDRFGSRTVTKLVPKLLCSPAPVPTGPTTTTTSTTVTTTTLPAGTEQALVCQRTIESGGTAYANKLMDEIEGCAAPGQSQALDVCLGTAAVQSELGSVESAWGSQMTADCPGVDLRHDLGYFETCPAPCTAPSTTISDVRSCLACRLRSTLTDAARHAYANQPVGSSSCRAALGDGSLGALRTTLQQLDTCTQQPGATSIAACFAPALAAWRSQAESTCAGIDPFGTLGYSQSCSGTPPVFPSYCAAEAPPCSFAGTNTLSGPGESDDLLDCLECQTEEAVLTIGRELHGTNLCCVSGVCNRVLTRFACRQAGGIPVRYRIDSLATGPVYGPHGIAWGLDGAFYIADSGANRVLKVSYVTNRCDHTITKFSAGGASSIVAGTSGTPGSSGDEGPSTAALITAPDGITVDSAGNVYFTESRSLSFVCSAHGPAATERVRVIDAGGTIHAFAGNASYGSGGEGGPQLVAQFGLPYGLRWTAGSLLVGEAGLERVMRIAGGTMTRVAGRPTGPVASHSGYGGPAARARFYENCGVGQDADGNVLIGPMEDNRIALVDSLGSVIAIAGTGEGSSSMPGDGGLALFGQAGCPEDLDVGPDGRIYFSDLQSSRIRVLSREQF